MSAIAEQVDRPQPASAQPLAVALEQYDLAAEKLGLIVRKMLRFIPWVDAVALLAVAAWLPAVCCVVAVPP